ncbi:hypothetical protein TNCV_1414741 [Trichonephila clavipes]|nr:hypothetical protein TNCV_1414741 [Trichonephila clavipes]
MPAMIRYLNHWATASPVPFMARVPLVHPWYREDEPIGWNFEQFFQLTRKQLFEAVAMATGRKLFDRVG